MNNSNGPLGGKPTVTEGEHFLSSSKDTPEAGNYTKVIGYDYKTSAASDASGTMTDVTASAGFDQLKQTYGNDTNSVTVQGEIAAAQYQGHSGFTTGQGGGVQESAVAYAAHVNASWTTGTPESNSTTALDGKMFYAQAKGQVLAGDDGRYQGLALGGVAEYSTIDGSATSTITHSIDWIPFVPKGWTMSVKGYGELQGAAVGAGLGGYAMRDRADNRVHIGAYGALALLFGVQLGGEINFGPAALTPQQQKEAAANAAAEAAAEKARAAADLIRPMARVTDPIGAHSSSHGWLGMALGACLAIAAIACFPIIIGVGVVGTGLMAAAMVGLGAVSLVTGAAAVGAKFGKLIKTEDGSPCSEIKKGSDKTFCEGKPIARINDANSHGSGKLKTGAKMVFDGGNPVSRVKEASTCGAAKVLKGAERTFVGGESVSSGAPDEPTAGDALLDKTIGVLDKISMITGLAQLPLLAVSALRTGGSMALANIASQAAERTTFREAMQVAASKGLTTAAGRAAARQAVVNSMPAAARVAGGATMQLAKDAVIPAAFAGGSHYAQPAMTSGLQSMGMSKEAAEAASQGIFLAGPAAFAGGIARTGKVVGESSSIPKEWANAGDSLSALREGKVSEGLFGKPADAGAPVRAPTDDVAGGASAEAPRTAANDNAPVAANDNVPRTAEVTPARVEEPTAPHTTEEPTAPHTTEEPIAAETPAPREPEPTTTTARDAVEPRAPDPSTPSADEILAAYKKNNAHYDQDPVFDGLMDHADSLPNNVAASTPELSYTKIDSDALQAIMDTGLKSGKALGKAPGENANNIWFKQGAPFYGDGITLAIPTSRLLELGGNVGVGLAGQKGVVRVPHDAAPDGIPFSEFAVVSAHGRDFVEPIWEPSWWEGGIGTTPPAELRPPGARTVDGATAGKPVAEVAAPKPTAHDAAAADAHVAAPAAPTADCTTCGAKAKSQETATATPGGVPHDAPAAVTKSAGDKGSAWAEAPAAAPEAAPAAAGTKSSPVVPDKAWPEQWPAQKPDAIITSSQQRVPVDNVTGAFQGEVSRAIVDQKKAAITDILNGGDGRLPQVRMAPDPMSPDGLAVLDGNHTFQAYKELGFTEIPAQVYNKENGVPYLLRQGGAIDPEARFGMDEMKFVDSFSGSPKQQRASRTGP